MSVWPNLKDKITSSNPLDGSAIAGFNFIPQERLQLLLRGLPLQTNALITRFVSSALGKICKTRTEILRELQAPWLARK